MWNDQRFSANEMCAILREVKPNKKKIELQAVVVVVGVAGVGDMVYGWKLFIYIPANSQLSRLPQKKWCTVAANSDA